MTTPKYESEISETIENFLYEFVMSNKGSISAEHGVGIFKRRRLRLVKTPESLELMKQLKVLVDPRNILNPYKVLPWWGTDQCQLCLNFWWNRKGLCNGLCSDLTYFTLYFHLYIISHFVLNHILYFKNCDYFLISLEFMGCFWDVFDDSIEFVNLYFQMFRETLSHLIRVISWV